MAPPLPSPTRSRLVAGLVVIVVALVALGFGFSDRLADGDDDGLTSSSSVPPDPTEAVWRVVARACGTGVENLAAGVAVGDGLIVTVAHVLEGTGSIEAAPVGPGELGPVEIVYRDPERDIAVLRTASIDGRWLPLGDAGQGDAVTVITPDGTGAETMTATIVRVVDVTLDGQGQRAGLELDADITAGDSGAPVIATDGSVVGIVFATDRAEPRGWAVAADEIEAALGRIATGPRALDC